jgi:hypothetical protein
MSPIEELSQPKDYAGDDNGWTALVYYAGEHPPKGEAPSPPQVPMRIACRSGSSSSLDTPAHHSVTNETQEFRSIDSIIREKPDADRRRFGVTEKSA